MSDPTRAAPGGEASPEATVTAPTVESRVAAGRQAAQEVPLESLGEYSAGPARPDPVALLMRQDESRMPDLVPVRHGRMLVSPFTFYRGAALLMASDLSRGARSPLDAQLCGDAHLSNFGAFASPERRLVFDINDFDETNPGPFEWDVKRLVTSMEVAGRDRGFSKKERTKVMRSTLAGYRAAMSMLAAAGNLDVWYASVDVDAVARSLQSSMKAKARTKSAKSLAKARTRTSIQAASKLTKVVDGQRQFIDDPPVLIRAQTLLEEASFDRQEITGAIAASGKEYESSLAPDRQHLLKEFTFVDLARKVVGVGSVGTRCWALLLQGRDPDDLLLLQIKEAEASVLEAYTQPSRYSQHGERVVQGQRILQSASDIFLGWNKLIDSDYYVRQLRDWKVSADIDSMDAALLAGYGMVCAGVLAKGHARSGDRIAISAYLGDGTDFDEALIDFARAYADQNEADYAQFKAAADAGRIPVEYGV